MYGSEFSWGLGRGALPLPYGNFPDRRMNFFNPKDNFNHPLMPNAPASRPGYGGGYGGGFPGKRMGGNQSQQGYNADRRFSSDGKTRPMSKLKDDMYACHLDRDKGELSKKKNKNKLNTNTKSSSTRLKQDDRILHRPPYNAWSDIDDNFKGGYGAYNGGYNRPQGKSLWENQ